MLRSKLLYLIGFIGLISFTCSGNESEKESLVPFEVIHKADYSSFGEKKYSVIKSQDDLNKFLEVVYFNLDQRPIYPDVDFDKHICIGLAMGNKNTGGFEIKADKLIERNKTITLSVYEVSPGKDCMVTKATTSPYEIIKFTKTGKEIKFITKTITQDCK